MTLADTQPAWPAEDLTICDLAADDLHALGRFYRDLAEFVVRTYRPYGYEVTDELLRDGPLAQVQAGEELAIVWKDRDGAIWGHAFIQKIHSDTPHLGVGVHQQLVGQGMGRKLTEALMDRARDAKLELVTLIVVQDNAPAWTLYQSLGFEIVGEQVGISEKPEESDGLAYYQMEWRNEPG
jgi:ribosomal protein S18 acetylase RimI-like enzyme